MNDTNRNWSCFDEILPDHPLDQEKYAWNLFFKVIEQFTVNGSNNVNVIHTVFGLYAFI